MRQTTYIVMSLLIPLLQGCGDNPASIPQDLLVVELGLDDAAVAARTVETSLKSILEETPVGVFMKTEIAGKACKFYMKGPDADILLSSIRQALDIPESHGGTAHMTYAGREEKEAIVSICVVP